MSPSPAAGGSLTDVVDSPYTIFINPNAFPAVHAEDAYAGEVFSYTTRWVRLNERSAQVYNGDIDGDPATNTLHFGNLTVGFEDVSLYLDRSFDAETFLSPFPMYFLEMLNTSSGRPWSELSNTNSLMGFFGEYDAGDLYLCGQVLVDDINASALAPILGWAIPSLNNIQNLSKVAWSLGGTRDTPFGHFGFYHGGALKYTYFPVTEFDAGGGTYKPLDYRKNYIGYTHGENNLAFLADYTAEFGGRKPWAFGLYSGGGRGENLHPDSREQQPHFRPDPTGGLYPGSAVRVPPHTHTSFRDPFRVVRGYILHSPLALLP